MIIIMLRYRNEGTTISVNLPRTDYTVYMMANYNKETDAYHTKLYIMRNDVEDLNLIDDEFKFKSNFATLKLDMTNYITEQFNKGYFKYYIDRYEYQQKCFEIGVGEIENADKE